MSFDDQIKPAFDDLAAGLRRDLSRQLDEAIGQLQERAGKIAEHAASQRAALVNDVAARVRLEAERAAEQKLAAAVAEAERAAQQRLMAEHEAAERAGEERLQRALAEAKTASATELNNLRDSMERTLAERVGTVIVDAERAATERLQRLANEKAEEAARVERATAERIQALLKEADESAVRRVSEAKEAAEAEGVQRGRQAAWHEAIAAGERLIDAFRAIDAANTLSEILGALAAGAAAETNRVALFLTSPTEIRSWRFLGFDPTFGPDDALNFPLSDAGLVAEAFAQQNVVAAGGGPHDGTVVAFASLAAEGRAIAVPVVVSGEVVTVLYADESGNSNDERPGWPYAVEVLARHAARALEAITAQRLARTLTDRTGTARGRLNSMPGSAGFAAAAPRQERVASPAPRYVAPRPIPTRVPATAAAPPVVAPAPSPVMAVAQPVNPHQVMAAPVPVPEVVPAVVGHEALPSPVEAPAPVAAAPEQPEAAIAASQSAPASLSDASAADAEQHAAAKAYAQELIAGIRLRNEPAVIAAVRDRDLMGRLGPEIARAWSLYEGRVPEAIRTNTNYFHSEMVRTLADGDASLLTPTQ